MLDFPDDPVSAEIWPDPRVPGVAQWQWDGVKWNRVREARGTVSNIPQCGRLILVNYYTLRFIPFNGDEIQVNGQIYQIPVAGIEFGTWESIWDGTNAGDTLYYLYLEEQSGQLVPRASMTGHQTDTTPGNEGVEIQIGNASRTLIGMCQIILPGTDVEFRDTPSQRLVASWFNRRGRTLAVNIGNYSLPTGGNAIPGQTQFLNWSDEEFQITAIGQGSHSGPVSPDSFLNHYLAGYRAPAPNDLWTILARGDEINNRSGVPFSLFAKSLSPFPFLAIAFGMNSSGNVSVANVGLTGVVRS